jgi:hypothetical protein
MHHRLAVLAQQRAEIHAVALSLRTCMPVQMLTISSKTAGSFKPNATKRMQLCLQAAFQTISCTQVQSTQSTLAVPAAPTLPSPACCNVGIICTRSSSNHPSVCKPYAPLLHWQQGPQLERVASPALLL